MIPAWIPGDAWSGYIAMRKQIKKPISDRAITLAIGKLLDLMNQGQDVGAVLDQSTFNCWQGLFPVKAEPVQFSPFRGGGLSLVDAQKAANTEAIRRLDDSRDDAWRTINEK